MNILADFYVHNLNPIIFSLGPYIRPRWYGFAYLMGFLAAYLLLRKQSRDGMLRLAPERVPDLVLNTCIVGVLIGGRMGFVLFYDLPNALKEGRTPMLWDFSASVPFWGALRVWDGGMAAHGGILFTILALAYFARRYKASFVNIGDAACMVVPAGLFFGRIANFINGELYGHAANVWWAVKFPSEVYAPTNGLNAMDPSVKEKLPAVMNQIIGPGDWYSAEGFEEGWRMLSTKLLQHQHDAVEAVAKIIPARHPSQLYEALLEGLLLFIICYTIGRLWKKDGMASGAFLTFYPIMRIIGEQFRVGDTPIHIAGMELSKGVLYSVPMAVIGAAFWGYWIVRNRRIPWIPPGSSPANAVVSTIEKPGEKAA